MNDKSKLMSKPISEHSEAALAIALKNIIQIRPMPKPAQKYYPVDTGKLRCSSPMTPLQEQ